MVRNRTVTAISPLALATISLVLAVSSIVLSLWPVVADPPWEPERVVERVIEPATLTGCDLLQQQLVEAGSDRGAYGIFILGRAEGCWR